MHAHQAVALLGVLALTMGAAAESKVVTYPGPRDEKPSDAYAVSVGGKKLFVYRARVREEIVKPPKGIWTHKHGGRTEWASFAYFDFAGKVTVKVTPKRPFKTARVAPASTGIVPDVREGTIRFQLDRPRQVTVLLDGRYGHPLHLFANPLETNRPDPKDPDVLYFGPGIHEIGTTRVRSGQTVYIAGGALVRGKILPQESGRCSQKLGLTVYQPILAVDKVRRVRICGRGIIDGGLIPHGGKSAISVSDSTDVEIEGIIIRNSSNWAICLAGCESVRVSNVKEISGRLNSDGINPVSSRKVRIADCFVRNRDDSIAVKATRPERPCEDILAQRCVIWNDWGFALGVTYETRAPIRGVTFRDCDVIHSEHWALGVHVVDSATVSDVRFENIRVEHAARQLIRLNVGKDFWSTDAAAGRIRGVHFKDVAFTGGGRPRSSILGHDAHHRVEGVTLENLRIGGQAAADAASARFEINAHTKDIRFVER